MRMGARISCRLIKLSSFLDCGAVKRMSNVLIRAVIFDSFLGFIGKSRKMAKFVDRIMN